MGLLKKCNDFNENFSGNLNRNLCLDSYRKELAECRQEILSGLEHPVTSAELLSLAEQFFEETVSNPYSIAGYYLVFHEDSFLEVWRKNITGKTLTVGDRKVSELLENIYASDIRKIKHVHRSADRNPSCYETGR